MSKIFSLKVKYNEKNEIGIVEPVNKVYLAKAVSYTDVEALAAEQLGSVIEGGIAVQSISPYKMTKYLENAETETDNLYKVDIEVNVSDEAVNSKPKFVKETYIVEADTTYAAEKSVDGYLSDSLYPYEVVKNERTKFVGYLAPEVEEEEDETPEQE